ncbi:MAG: hypothetical protein Q618_VCMC00003G0183 [Varibaculum cambriense DORA_20]|nr:MAG: hypothetical protein Q618_VCMC00003G0183 [Varibaculum cambriense DORA_20]
MRGGGLVNPEAVRGGVILRSSLPRGESLICLGTDPPVRGGRLAANSWGARLNIGDPAGQFGTRLLGLASVKAAGVPGILRRKTVAARFWDFAGPAGALPIVHFPVVNRITTVLGLGRIIAISHESRSPLIYCVPILTPATVPTLDVFWMFSGCQFGFDLATVI